MAFGSDFRVKYLMRDVQRIVTERLSKEGIENPLRLRVFDEDAGDNMLWDKGGLTFTTKDNENAGSGDGAWYVEKHWTDPISKKKSSFSPVLVIEGTFGTETGNVGDAQKTKISHIFELPQRNILSAILMPKVSEYYTSGKNKNKPKPTHVVNAWWMKGMVMASIALSQKWNCETMFIDAYDKKQLLELVYALAKQEHEDNEKNEMYKKEQIQKIMCEMVLYVDKYVKEFYTKPRRASTPLIIFDLPMKNGEFSTKWIAKIHTDDVKAFGITTGKNPKAVSRHRNQHRLLGNILELNIITGKSVFLLLPRWNKDDLKKLREKEAAKKDKQKEFANLEKNKELDLLTMDDIDFGKDIELKENFKRIRSHGIALDAKLPTKMAKELDQCCIKLKFGLYSKKYKIKR